MADNSSKANFVAKTLFIAGGIILFIVLVIFIFKMVPVAISNLSNLGSNISSQVKKTISGDEIVLKTENDSVDVKSPILLSFEYTPKDSGQYFFSYKCIDGLFFDIQSQDGPKRVICDTPLKLGTDLNSISIIPLFTQGNNFADSVVTISYRDSKNNTIASGSKTITIKGEENSTSTSSNPFNANGSLSGSNVTTKPITTTKTNTSNTSSQVYSRPTKDLAITYIGAIDSQSTFVIHVYNYGNTSTGPWEFSYTDAENPSRTISSPIQASLAANQGLAITVRFDGQDNSKQTIEVVADPLNKISESNESNNKASVVISGSRSNSNNNSSSYNSKEDADLIIKSMEVGRISGNKFIEDDEIDENDTAAVRFIVKNQGGESSGSWRFEIDNLPYNNDDSYRSKTYSSLRPGQSIEIIADFDNIDERRYSIKVNVDSDDDVDEERENNNTESETLEVNN